MHLILIRKQWRLAQHNFHVPFDHAVFNKYHFRANNFISDQVSMYSLVSFFSAAVTFSVKQLKLEKITCTTFYVDFITLSFFLVLKMKIDLVKLAFQTHQVIGGYLKIV